VFLSVSGVMLIVSRHFWNRGLVNPLGTKCLVRIWCGFDLHTSSTLEIKHTLVLNPMDEFRSFGHALGAVFPYCEREGHHEAGRAEGICFAKFQ
jgi:hypothetical protein